MAPITMVKTSDHMNGYDSTINTMTMSSPNNINTNTTTYLLLTTSSETKPVIAKSSLSSKRSNNSLLTNNSNSSLRAKRKIQFATSGERHPAPPAVARRNERERNRVRQVNMGFATLRQHVPNGTKTKKMSKVETLRSAVQYIKQLTQLLDETGHSDNGDENSVPSFDDASQYSTGHHQHPHQVHHHPNGQMNENMGLVGVTSPPYSAASSPTPSLGSEASSPYGSLSPEDEDLLDFTTWLS